MSFNFRKVFAAGLIVAALSAPKPAFAVSRDVRAVFITGFYGIGAGTVMGVMAWTATRELRSVFMGSSIGLYLGIIVGFYFISHRDNVENPLLYEDLELSTGSNFNQANDLGSSDLVRPPELYFEYPVMRF